MAHLLDAVKYIHDENVIHRDLKLGNLFLDKNLNVKVGDFGLATRLEDKDEKRKTICGTPNYIAPEVIQQDKSKRGHSFEVDVWSMGVILYTVLMGKPPYEAKDVKATYQRILKNEYSFPEHVPISEHAMDLIDSMLQLNPNERYVFVLVVVTAGICRIISLHSISLTDYTLAQTISGVYCLPPVLGASKYTSLYSSQRVACRSFLGVC